MIYIYNISDILLATALKIGYWYLPTNLVFSCLYNIIVTKFVQISSKIFIQIILFVLYDI